MIKKFTRICSLLLACTAVLCLCAGCFDAKNYHEGFDDDVSDCGLYDEKNVFDSDEYEELDELIRDYSATLDMYIAIYLSDTNHDDPETEDFAYEKYVELFGEDTDGVLYYMDLSEIGTAYDFIFTSGKATLAYQDNLDSMFDEIYRYLPSTGEEIYADDINDAVYQICEEIDKYHDYDPGIFGYEYDPLSDKYFYYSGNEFIISHSRPPIANLKYVFIGLVAGVIAALICYFTTKSRYRFKSSCNPSVYVSNEDTKFTQREDLFIRTYTTKTKIESSSGGRSGGGGGRSGGGRGGGRHR